MHVILEVDGEPHEIWLTRTGNRVSLELGGQTWEAAVETRGDALEVRLAGQAHRVRILGPEEAVVDGAPVTFRIPFFAPGGAPGKHDEGEGGAARVKPPMPGRVVAVKVREGEAVRKGQVLLILEAMKMQNEVLAPTAGKVAKVHVREGQVVDASAPLLDIEG
jgi:biotin carboxyl carrier protein